MNQTRLDDLDLEFHKGYKIHFNRKSMQFRENRALMLMLFGVLMFWILGSSNAFAITTIDFNSRQNGEIITNQFAGQGVSMSANNPNQSFDLAIIFNTQRNQGGDSDLTGPDDCPPWANGNISTLTEQGNILIIAEHDDDDFTNDADMDGVCDQDPPSSGSTDGLIDIPDDQAKVDGSPDPAGTLSFVFSDGVCLVGIDVMDIELGEVPGGFFLSAMSMGGVPSNIPFEEFESGGLFDVGALYGDHSINRLGPFTAAELGLTDIDTLEITFDGSGAVDNLVFEECFVGGTGFKIDKTALLLAGAQTNAVWLLPVIISAIGIGFFFIRKN